MSRSRKKNPITKGCPKGGIGKKFANRKVRRKCIETSSGCSYKKQYSQYDIHDWVTRTTLNEHLEWWSRWKTYEERDGRTYNYFGCTIQDAIRKWKREYYWK